MEVVFIDEEEEKMIRQQQQQLMDVEEKKKKKLMMVKEEMFKKMKLKFVLHTSPLEIVDDAIDDEDTELIIDLQNHYSISQYWCPRSSSSSSSSCQKHPEYFHPQDDDDEDMILASCQPSLGGDSSPPPPPPRRKKIVIKDTAAGGVFADTTTTTLPSNVDILFERCILPTPEQLIDLKTSIIRRIDEAKEHVQMVKPRKVRICVDVSQISKRYFRSAEAATFVAAMDAMDDAASRSLCCCHGRHGRCLHAYVV